MQLRSMAWMAGVAVCATTALAGDAGQLPAGVDPETGFRMERYRAPVPDFIPGGKVVDVDGVLSIIAAADGTVLVDVYPPRGAGPDPIDGSWRITEKRENIEGSVWLPDVGRGYLEADLEGYFRRNLEHVTGGDATRGLVFYCTADCWQGWNAARRAILWGYGNVSWFPVGTDGWHDRGLPVVTAEPVNFLEP